MDVVYQFLQQQYEGTNIPIIVYGYSIGTGPAAYLSQKHEPKFLVLQAPYNNLDDLRRIHFSWIPNFCLKYHFPVNAFIKDNQIPIHIIHGDQDNNIPIYCSYELQKLFNEGDQLYVIEGNSHAFSYENEQYREVLEGIFE